MKLRDITEMMEKERKIRKGKWKIVYSSNKEGYKIINKDGVRKEVRMDPEEQRNRDRAARRTARKNKGKMASIIAKRKRSMAKYG